jgi:hypothetical protein
MLIHDMSDLSYMIEKRTRDEHLLARADALVERRMGRPGMVRGSRRGTGRTRRKAAS